MKPICLIIIIPLYLTFLSTAYSQIEEEFDYYQEGKSQIAQGEIEHGIRVWLQAHQVYREQDIVDPRIGFELIRYVTKLEAENLFQIASEIYFWGLNALEVEPWEDYLFEEVEFLQAIIEKELYDKWVTHIKNHDVTVYESIRNFWLDNELVLSTPQNERLIEHWQRIHHARSNFTKNDNTVYGTDDRGLIYVRYGQPDVEKRRMLNIDTGELRNKAYDLMEYGYISSHREVQNIVMSVAQSYTPRELDLWRYNNLNQKEPVIFIFGSSGDQSGYGLRERVEDFIPTHAFRNVVYGRHSGTGNIRAGNLLQFMLYNQLVTIDEHFGRQLSVYEQNWHHVINHGNLNVHYLNSLNDNSHVQRAMERNRESAPVQVSDFKRYLVSYPISISQYKFLNDDHTPVTLMTITPDPFELIAEVENTEGQAAQVYTLIQGIQISDTLNRQNSVNGESLTIDNEIDTIDTERYTSFLWIHYLDQVKATLFSELYTATVHEADRNYLLGMVTEEIDIKYHTGGHHFAVSDLVLGSTNNKPHTIRNKEIGLLPANKISVNEILQVYVEVYNFDIDDGGTGYFIQYTLQTHAGDDLQVEKTPVTLMWEDRVEDPHTYEFFEVDLENVAPGAYSLQIEIREIHSERVATTKTDLIITQ